MKDAIRRIAGIAISKETATMMITFSVVGRDLGCIVAASDSIISGARKRSAEKEMPNSVGAGRIV